jgi:hypothetical protein
MEDKAGDNGGIEQQKPQFKQFIKIFFNDETGEYAFETNVPNTILGYGMLEFGKKGIDTHLVRMKEKQIQVAKGGILNFVRGARK